MRTSNQTSVGRVIIDHFAHKVYPTSGTAVTAADITGSMSRA